MLGGVLCLCTIEERLSKRERPKRPPACQASLDRPRPLHGWLDSSFSSGIRAWHISTKMSNRDMCLKNYVRWVEPRESQSCMHIMYILCDLRTRLHGATMDSTCLSRSCLLPASPIFTAGYYGLVLALQTVGQHPTLRK